MRLATLSARHRVGVSRLSRQGVSLNGVHDVFNATKILCMNQFDKSPGDWLPADVIAAQPKIERRLIEQMLHGERPPTVQDVEAGTNLFKQGFFAQALHLVLAGEVIVTVDGAEIARLGPGSMLGEMAMLGNRQRTGTVTAVIRTTIASLGESSFDREDLLALAASRRPSATND